MPRKEKAIRWRREVEWVYRNMDVACPEHVEAFDWCRRCLALLKRKPSRGAVRLWKLARKDPQWFFTNFVGRFAGQKEEVLDAEKEGKLAVGDTLDRLEAWEREWAQGQSVLPAGAYQGVPAGPEAAPGGPGAV